MAEPEILSGSATKNLKEKFGGEKQACRKNFMPSARDVRLDFTTWDECRAQVHGFPCAEYKSFPTMEGAKGFMKLGIEGENQLPIR